MCVESCDLATQPNEQEILKKPRKVAAHIPFLYFRRFFPDFPVEVGIVCVMTILALGQVRSGEVRLLCPNHPVAAI
jgi:hypothetical protein